MTAVFRDRDDAAHKLCAPLEKYRNENPVILALPRGGLPLGYKLAQYLDAPLDVLLVRKIGVPMYPELAAGAIVDGDDPQLVLNEEIVELYKVPKSYIDQRVKQKLAEIEQRRKLYRPGKPPIDVTDCTVIVVDDGIATGSTVRAALKALRNKNVRKLILAVPVAPSDTLAKLKQDNAADEIICLETPYPFMAVGNCYLRFGQVSDQKAIEYLQQAAL